MSANARTLLEERLRRDQDQIIRFVQDLTQIPSENPPGDTTQVFDYLMRYLEERNVPFEVVAPEPSTKRSFFSSRYQSQNSRQTN